MKVLLCLCVVFSILDFLTSMYSIYFYDVDEFDIDEYNPCLMIIAEALFGGDVFHALLFSLFLRVVLAVFAYIGSLSRSYVIFVPSFSALFVSCIESALPVTNNVYLLVVGSDFATIIYSLPRFVAFSTLYIIVLSVIVYRRLKKQLVN